MPTFEYAGHSIDFAALPEASISALLHRGAIHFLGNEQASKVSAKQKQAENATPPVEVTDEMKAAWKAEFVALAVTALQSGTIGVRAAGTGIAKPKLDRLQTMVRKLAKAGVMDLLAKGKLKAPKGDATIKLGEDHFTMEQLIERRIAKVTREVLEADAKKLLAAEDRMLAKAGEGEGLDTL